MVVKEQRTILGIPIGKAKEVPSNSAENPIRVVYEEPFNGKEQYRNLIVDPGGNSVVVYAKDPDNGRRLPRHRVNNLNLHRQSSGPIGSRIFWES